MATATIAPTTVQVPPVAHRRGSPPPRGLFWAVMTATLFVTTAVVGLGGWLFATHTQTREVAPQEKLIVPHADADWEPWRRWVVQEDGRNKPFDSFCREAVRTVTGRERFEGNDPVLVVGSWMLLHESERTKAEEVRRQASCDWEHYSFLLCDAWSLRGLLYRDLRGEPSDAELHGKYVAPSDLRNSPQFQDVLRTARQIKRKNAKAPLSHLQAKALEVAQRLDLYDRIADGGAFGVVALDGHSAVWFPLAEVQRLASEPGKWEEALRNRRAELLHEYEGRPPQAFPLAESDRVVAAWTALRQAYRGEDRAALASAAAHFQATTVEVNRTGQVPSVATTELELKYNRFVPFQKAWLFGLLASALLLGRIAAGPNLLGRGFYLGGLLAYCVAMTVSGIGFWCRVAISGRPPVSNMYESVIWVAFACAAFGLFLELIYRQGVIAFAGALVSTLGFVLADQLPLALDPKISPLVAVLRSNYWLIIHVLTIVSSYAAFALAWGLGNLNLGMILFAPGRQDTIKTLSQFSYRAIQLGVVLLFAGTMLGGFWAAESWGRFWGWDPKEVWALIAFLCYIIPLHARYVGWVKDFGLAICAVVCFAAIVMAWYGVNFVLAAGLHSYGFGGGNNLWVTWAALLNINVVLAAALRHLRHRALLAA